MNNDFYLEKLQIHFESKRAKNPAYSLRAFARDLEIDNGNLNIEQKDATIGTMRYTFGFEYEAFENIFIKHNNSNILIYEVF